MANNSSPDFWTRAARKYAESPIGNPESYEATLARTQSYLRKTDEVLEIGAGTSSTALRLAPSVKRYVSSDYSAGMVEIGQEKAWEASIPSLTVVEGGLGDPSLGSGPYNAVLAFNLLHLVPDLDDTFAEVAKLLPKGGLFISKTPCLARRFGLFRVMIGVLHLLGKAPHVSLFTATQLERRIVAAGFELIETRTYQRFTRTRYIVARKL
ncbi:methyltransferase domain-containing protein [Rhodobacterales bacterium HKCCE3408]|nr:methyltransferase domain-containing protein [Rhodobacterales bacterium HKCCE3408]